MEDDSWEEDEDVEWGEKVYVGNDDESDEQEEVLCASSSSVPVIVEKVSNSNSSDEDEDDEMEKELLQYLEDSRKAEEDKVRNAQLMIYSKTVRKQSKISLNVVDLGSYECHKRPVTGVPECAAIMVNTKRRVFFDVQNDKIASIPQEVEYVPTSYESTGRICGEVVGGAVVHAGDTCLQICHVTEFAYLVMACLMKDRLGVLKEGFSQRVVGCDGPMKVVVRLLCDQHVMHELALLEPGKTSTHFDREVDSLIERSKSKVPTGKSSQNKTMDDPEYAIRQLIYRKAAPEMALSKKAMTAACYYLGVTGNVKNFLELNMQQRGFTVVALKTPKNSLCDSNTVPGICKSSRNMSFSYTTTVSMAQTERIPEAEEKAYVAHYLPDVWTENAPPLAVTHQIHRLGVIWHDLRTHYVNSTNSLEEKRTDVENDLTMNFYKLFYRVYMEGKEPNYFCRFYTSKFAVGMANEGFMSSMHSMCELNLLWIAYVLHITKHHQSFSSITRKAIDITLQVMAENDPSFSSKDGNISCRMREFYRLLGVEYFAKISRPDIKKYLFDRCDFSFENSKDHEQLWKLVDSKAANTKKSRFYQKSRVDHFVILIYLAVRARVFQWKLFYKAVNGLVTRIFSKKISKEFAEYYWTNDHIYPMCIMPTLNRAMYFAIRAYHHLRNKPIPSLRVFYTPITSNVVYEPIFLQKLGLRQLTLKNHRLVPFDGVAAIDRSVLEFRSNVALPCRYVHSVLPVVFLEANVRASSLVCIKSSQDGQKNYLVASKSLPVGTDLGVLAGVEWLYAERKKKTDGRYSKYDLENNELDPYVWQNFVGESDDGHYNIFLQISTKHYGNFLRHVRVSANSNSRFSAVQPGIGAKSSSEEHFSRLPIVPHHRRYWRLRTNKPIPKGGVIYVSK